MLPSALAKRGKWQLARSQLNRLPNMRVIPKQVSYGAAIGACENESAAAAGAQGGGGGGRSGRGVGGGAMGSSVGVW